MKTLLAAILLATTAMAAIAEPRPRQVKAMCASFEDVEATMEKYGEKLIIATHAPNELTVNLLYVNFETHTSSWFIHDLQTDEYCMMGIGKEIYTPKESPLNNLSVGTKVIY